MRNILKVAAVACLLSSPSLAFLSAEPNITKVEGGFADLVETLSPAVVNISTTQKVTSGGSFMGLPGMPGFRFEGTPNSPEMELFRDFFEQFGQMQPQERDVSSLGSGFIISADGFVITNNHVVAQADEITVTLQDNRKFSAEVIGRDPKTDLALMKIESDKALPFVPLGDSDKMRVGDWVIAIGNPFGLGGSVTKGIISARQRSINAGPFDDFLQTDAPINRGNSGGPLFNLNGEVIGINTAIFSPSGGSVGIGFAIPTALAKPVISQLKETGQVRRGWLGVKIQEVSDEIAESLGMGKAGGALVLGVGKDSPAEKAGIKQGDVIVSFNGKPIKEMRFLPRIVAETNIGSSVSVGIWRGGKMISRSVTIGELEEDESVASSRPSSQKKMPESKTAQTMLGMELVPLNSTLRKRLRLPSDAEGLVVADISRSSAAAGRGMRNGDVISAINNVPVTSAAGMKKLLEDARKKGRGYVLVTVLRGKEEAFITLPSADKN